MTITTAEFIEANSQLGRGLVVLELGLMSRGTDLLAILQACQNRSDFSDRLCRFASAACVESRTIEGTGQIELHPIMVMNHGQFREWMQSRGMTFSLPLEMRAIASLYPHLSFVNYGKRTQKYNECCGPHGYPLINAGGEGFVCEQDPVREQDRALVIESSVLTIKVKHL
jgi:hypothetical protein